MTPNRIFLSSEISGQAPETARFHILPVPYEKTVSYGKGTAKGPAAILAAGLQLETFDGFSCPCDEGIYTWDTIDCAGDGETVISEIKQMVNTVCMYGADKIPILLGGEHTITNGSMQAFHESGLDFGIVQFDAHADLRHTYGGSLWSHACVMKRALDLKIPVFQIGVRAISLEETATREKHASLISFLDGFDLGIKGIPPGNLLPHDFPEKVFVSMDIDAIDPSVIPATGTPVPGGITWYQMQELLRKVANERTIIGADLVELAPIEGFHAPDFAAARLIYDLMGIIQRSEKYTIWQSEV